MQADRMAAASSAAQRLTAPAAHPPRLQDEKLTGSLASIALHLLQRAACHKRERAQGRCSCYVSHCIAYVTEGHLPQARTGARAVQLLCVALHCICYRGPPATSANGRKGGAVAMCRARQEGCPQAPHGGTGVRCERREERGSQGTARLTAPC
jgi:hypothetical protein